MSFDSQRAKLVPHAAPMGIAHPSAHTPPLDGHLQGPVIQPPSILQQSSFTWLLVTFVALSLNGANLVGYWRCEKDAKQKMSDFSGNSVVQGAIGNFIASRFTTMFSGSSHTSAPRPEMHV
ncbi:hypothetical protein SeMB42_g01635 [Synchytrium endobioticum]|uniref:Uncharacterized protein n=1 Tax=Synchytrium endobioticum TaxID=286115 RepID=A0A507DLR9_9FUNG|nr:hypothetical protein SeMB42_g01635 [Synchytrium endobioticum]